MPEESGFDVLRVLDREGSRVAAVVLTGSDSHSDYLQVVRLGARGLVLKGDDLEHLFSAIRAVAGGELWFPPEIAQQVLAAMAGETTRPTTSIQRLSERERQIAKPGGVRITKPRYRRPTEDQREHGEASSTEHLR